MTTVAKNESETFYPKTRKAWRQWLQKNHLKKKSVGLIYYKKGSKKQNLTWSDAVDEALCFGWIDSTRRPIDHEKFIQSFSPRKSKSTWSKINKDKVARLIEEGLMTDAGFKSIEVAKKNGSWNILDSVEDLHIPPDLSNAFKQHAGSRTYFLSLSRSVKKQLLHWLVTAKREETRSKRIREIVEQAAQGKKPKHIL